MSETQWQLVGFYMNPSHHVFCYHRRRHPLVTTIPPPSANKYSATFLYVSHAPTNLLLSFSVTMARSSLLGLSCLLVFINVCFAQFGHFPQEFQGGEAMQQHRFHSPRACRLENLRAQEPVRRAEAEAGSTEVWDQYSEEFQCAGVNMLRHKIRSRGLLLPGFSNAPKLIFVVQGTGIRGVAIPGCAETYQTDLRRSQSAGSAFRDQHQKIRQFREGDLLVVPAGVSHWIYNRGQSDLILIVFTDTRNVANQIDPYLRKFFLAGRPEMVERGAEEMEGRSRRGSVGEKSGNMFSGFADELLEEAFKIDSGLVRRLKGEDDERDRIVQVDEDFDVLLPERDEQERSRGRYIESESENGFEETICTLRLKHNIGRSERADVFNPRGGRISTANNHNLPFLRQVRLSAERGVLSKSLISTQTERARSTALHSEQPHGVIRDERQRESTGRRRLRTIGVQRRGSERTGTDDSTELRSDETSKRQRIRVDCIQDERQRYHEPSGGARFRDEDVAAGSSVEHVPDFKGGGTAAEVRATGDEDSQPRNVAGKKRLKEMKKW